MAVIRVVGLDPSMSNFGIVRSRVDMDTLEVEIEDMILAKTTSEARKNIVKQSDDLRRATVVRDALIEHTQHAAVVISEIPYCNPGTYASANFNAGLVTGVLASCPVPVIQVNPSEVKMAAVGHRQAGKEEMLEWALGKHPNAPWLMRKYKGTMRPIADNEHLADALATIYAGLQTNQFKQLATLFASVSRVAA